MSKRVSSLLLAIAMLLQTLVPQTAIAKEGAKAPSDNLVKVGMINGNSYDSKLMLELNRQTAKNRRKRAADPGARLFGYFEEGQEPKDEDKPKYHGEVKAKLLVKGLDENEFQWNDIFGKEEVHLRFIQINDETGAETGIERVLNITKAGTYTWTDGDGYPAELPLFNNKLEPLIYEVKLDEEVSDRVKLLTARLTTTDNASPTFEKPDAQGRIKYHLTLEIGLQQVASSKFVSEWHTAVGENERPQLEGTMIGSMDNGKSKTINFNHPKNNDDEVIVKTKSRRDKNKFLPEFLFKKPTVKLVETNANGLTFDTTKKTVKSGDHKYKYDFKYDVVSGGKLTMTEIIPVTFNANGGKFASIADPAAEQKIKSEVDYEKDVTAPKAPTKEGETFIGWGENAKATTPVSADAFKGIKEAKTFYAIFTKDIIEQEGDEEPENVPAGHVKVTVDVTDKAQLGQGEKQTRFFWVDPKKEVTLPVIKPTGKDVPVSDTNSKAYTWEFTKWTSDESAPRTWSDGITATFPKETTITANYDKKVSDQGTVDAKEITVHESFKKSETEWVNNFIPKADTLKAAVKVKDASGNEGNLPAGAKVELVDDSGAAYADDAALKNALYDKLKEKANPDDKPTRVEKVKAKVTFKNSEVQTVDIPIKVFKNIYEAKTLSKKPHYVPADYVKVTLDPTKKAQDSQKTYYYVNKDAQVVIPGEDPVGTGDNKFVKWTYDDNGTETEYKLSEKPRHQFEKATTITAQYESDVIPQTGNDKPTTVPSNYVSVTFDPTANGTLEGTKIFWVNPDKEVTIPVGTPSGKEYFTFTEWKINDTSYNPKDKKQFTKNTKVTANYKEAPNIIPYDPTDFNDPKIVRPDGYVRVTFAADTGLKLTESKAYYVKKNAGITLGNTELAKPAYKEETGYTFKEWDKKDETVIEAADIVVTANATKLDKVIPEKDDKGNKNDKPEGYKEVTFVIKDDDKTKGSIEGVAKFYVNPTEYVTINPPKTKAETGFKFGAWDKDAKIPTVYKEDTTIIGSFNGLEDIIPKTNPDGTENKKPAGYVAVTFYTILPERGKIADGETTVYYVKPNTPVTIPAPKTEANTGYKFDQWYLMGVQKYPSEAVSYDKDREVEGRFVELYSFIPSTDENGKPNAKYPGYVTVTFTDGKYGTITSGKKVYYVNPNANVKMGDLTLNTNKNRPQVTPDTGYKFGGWLYGTNHVIKKDLIVPANYTYEEDIIPKTTNDESEKPKGYITVTFDKGEHGTLSGQAVYYVNPNKAVALEDKAPKVTPNTGYDFADWDTQIEKKIQYSDGDIIKALYNEKGDVIPQEKTDGSDKPAGYLTVTFDKGKHGTLDGKTVYYVKPNKEVTVPAPTVKPETGWKQKDGTDAWDKALTQKFTDENTTITAQYASIDNIVPGDKPKPDGYVTVKFVGKNGTLSGTTTYYVNPNKEVDLKDQANGLSKKADVGYTADGGTWDKLKGKFTEGEKITFTFVALPDVIEGKPGATKPEGYVTVNFLAGSYGSLEGQTVYYVNPEAGVTIGDAAAEKVIATPTPKPDTDCDFDKWEPKIDKTKPITRDQNYVAQFVYNPATVTLTYKAPDKTFGEVPDAQTVKKGDKVILAGANTLKKDNATLWGWEIDGKEYPIGVSVTLEKDSTATALWKTNSHTVDFDTKGGTHVPPRTVEHGKSIGQVDPPTKDGFTFTGWTLNGNPFDPKTGKITGKTTLVANYVPNVVEQPDPNDPTTKPAVPDNFVKVTVDPTNKAQDSTTQVFWVNPDKEVTIPAGFPEGKDMDQFRYVFTGWDHELTDQFTEPETTIKAQYVEKKYDPEVDTYWVLTDKNVLPKLEDYEGKIRSRNGETITLEEIVKNPDVSKPNSTSFATIRIRFNNGATKEVEVPVFVKPDPIIEERPYPVPGDCNNSCDQPNKPNKPNQPNIGMDALNTTDHYQYLIGYPDGNFAPNRGMTRAEVATMFTRLLKERPVKGQRYYTGFSDIQAGDWYANTVGYAVQVGIVSGYPDGSFKPNKPITRAEFAAIASRFDALAQGNNIAFNDLAPSHWGYNAIRSAASKGWITGYPDDTFRPEKAITRAEVTSITNRMLNRYADLYWIDAHRGEVIRFGDVKRSDWYFEPIMEATMGHDFIRDRDGKTEHWTGVNGNSFI